MTTVKGHLQLKIEHFSQLKLDDGRKSEAVVIQKIPWILKAQKWESVSGNTYLGCFILCNNGNSGNWGEGASENACHPSSSSEIKAKIYLFMLIKYSKRNFKFM